MSCKSCAAKQQGMSGRFSKYTKYSTRSIISPQGYISEYYTVEQIEQRIAQLTEKRNQSRYPAVYDRKIFRLKRILKDYDVFLKTPDIDGLFAD